MWWRYLYLLLTMGILCIEAHREPRILRKNKVVMNKIVRRQHNYMRIRNEYPIQLQDEEQNIHNENGNVTNTWNFPYMAAIIINGKLWCAGAIVDVNWVLTAAHCLNFVLRVSSPKSLAPYVKVRVGSSNVDDGGIIIDVVSAIMHPKYQVEPVPHADVALLKLVSNLDYYQFVNRIKLYEGSTEPYAQSFVEVSGWGATMGSELGFYGHTSEILTARLKVRPHRYCVDSYQLVDAFQFTDDFFCASLRNGTRDVCLFDAGAPAVQNNRLMGVMSFGPEKCGHVFQPAVFIKTFYFRDFVNSVIKESQPHESKRPETSLPKNLPPSAEELAVLEEDYGPANIIMV